MSIREKIIAMYAHLAKMPAPRRPHCPYCLDGEALTPGIRVPVRGPEYQVVGEKCIHCRRYRLFPRHPDEPER